MKKELDGLTNATNVVEIAYQIIDMHKTIQRQNALIAELEDYKKSYIELLSGWFKNDQSEI